jgi:DNA-binding transcriptional LysR family regulator
LAEQDFVGPLPGWIGLEPVNQVVVGNGDRRRVLFQGNDVFSVLDFVAHGLGVTIVPEYEAVSRPELRAIRLADESLIWTLAAVVSRNHAAPAARAFLALLPEFRTAGQRIDGK